MKLNESENFYSELNESIYICCIYFCSLINQVCDKIKNENILLYCINIIHHVFNYILFYTKNLPMTLMHSKNAYIYYIEFIEQIKNKNNLFLKLKKEDAALFVYKKTIFNINENDIKSKKKNLKIEKIYNLTKLYKFKIQQYLMNDEKNKNINEFCNDIKKEIKNKYDNDFTEFNNKLLK